MNSLPVTSRLDCVCALSPLSYLCPSTGSSVDSEGRLNFPCRVLRVAAGVRGVLRRSRWDDLRLGVRPTVSSQLRSAERVCGKLLARSKSSDQCTCRRLRSWFCVFSTNIGNQLRIQPPQIGATFFAFLPGAPALTPFSFSDRYPFGSSHPRHASPHQPCAGVIAATTRQTSRSTARATSATTHAREPPPRTAVSVERQALSALEVGHHCLSARFLFCTFPLLRLPQPFSQKNTGTTWPPAVPLFRCLQRLFPLDAAVVPCVHSLLKTTEGRPPADRYQSCQPCPPGLPTYLPDRTSPSPPTPNVFPFAATSQAGMTP